MYQRKSRVTPRQQSKRMEHFVAGTTARAASKIIGIQPNTAIQFYQRLRRLIASKLPGYTFRGEVEVDESYFGGDRNGKRGRSSAGKVAFFGLLKRGGKVYAAIIPEAKTETLLPIIYQKLQPDSIVYRDTFRSCNALDISTFHHRRINHFRLFADQHNHINRIENFGTKQNGVSRSLMASKSRNSSGF